MLKSIERAAPWPGDVPPASGPRPLLAPRPGPAGPGRISLYKLAGRAGEAPGPVPLFLTTLWTAGHGSTRHVTRPPAVRARARVGPLRRRRQGSRDSTAKGDRSEGWSLRFRLTLALRRVFASSPRTCWSWLDASRDSTAVWRAHGPGWARCAASRQGSRISFGGRNRGGTMSSALASSLLLQSRWSDVRGGGGRCSPPPRRF